MLESLSCPSCFTKYGLRPERVHPGIRRARCFRCGDVFDAEEAIHRLLPPDPALDLVQSPDQSSDQSLAEASATATLEGIRPEDLLELNAQLSAPTAAAEPEPLSQDSALTLGDLEGAEDEILEKTLVLDPPADLGGEPPEDENPDGAGSYSSAKDAISRLLGSSPAATPSDRRGSARGNTMDVEATLDALENTLSGTSVRNPASPEPAQAMGSTIRLSSTELQAAMAAGAPTFQLPAPASSSPASPRPAFALQPHTPSSAEANPITPAGDTNLLKIQVGQDTFQNVTLDQVTGWIEQGRVQDWHMVSRQFSDNWIEAGKVPSLRPIFERIRRMAPQTQANLPQESPAAIETAPVKKSLFGWMSNRN